MTHKKNDIPLTKGKRTARLAGLSSRLTAHYALAKLRGAVSRAPKREDILNRFHQHSAEQLVESMGAMKGAVMKLGQMASFVTDDVPSSYQRMLQGLQSQSQPMPFSTVRKVVEQQLGGALFKLFLTFDESPLAAASIGQVHRAVLPDGTQVVVKVQYPGVDEAVRADLENLRWVKPMMSRINPNMDAHAIGIELKERLNDELNYRTEAANQQAFAELYRGHPYISIPQVYLEYSSEKVLTSAFVEGHDFAWLCAQDNDTRQRAAETLFRFAFGTIYEHQALNGDPHPGNYIFHAGGRITFIDFGCVKYFSDTLMSVWRPLTLAHLTGDRITFRRLAEEIGFIPKGSKISSDLAYDFFEIYYRPFDTDTDFLFEPGYTKETLKNAFAPSDSRYKALIKEVRMPQDMVFVNRIQWGLYAILTKLQAQGNYHRMVMEALGEACGVTPLTAAWKNHRKQWYTKRQYSLDTQEVRLRDLIAHPVE